MTTLSHYTSYAGLQGIIQSGTLWATNFLELNDTSEYFYSWSILTRRALSYVASRAPEDIKLQHIDEETIRTQIIPKIRQTLKSSHGYEQPYTFSFASSSSEDQEQRGILTLWDRYTHNEGYCLQFNMDEIQRKLEFELMKGSYFAAGITEIKYGVDENTHEFRELSMQLGEYFLSQLARTHQSITPNYKNLWALEILARRIMNYCATRKDPCFEDEREVRVFFYPSEQADARVFTGIADRKKVRTSSSGKRYIAFGEFWRPGIVPHRIIIGPKSKADILPILSNCDPKPEISQANMPIA